MKKLLSLIFIFVLSFSVAACSSQKTEQTNDVNNLQEEAELSQQNEKETTNENDHVQKDTAKNEMPTFHAEQRENPPSLSIKDAELLVREHLGLQGNNTLHVEVDHEEGNKYVVHVYEMVKHDDFSHTATYGWYYVDKDTGKIEDMME